MMLAESIFLQFELPNATTWFYFSAILAIALFFKFSRLLSVRNLDVLSLYLLVPGFLLLLEHRAWYGYLWLFFATAYFLVRCLFDLVLVSRPALSANLNSSGLTWLALALFVSLIAVALRGPEKPEEGKQLSPGPVDQVEKKAKTLFGNFTEVQGDPNVLAVRSLAIIGHLAIAAALIFIGMRHFQDVHAGIAAATFYLLLPYTYLLLPNTALPFARWYHVWPMVMILWAVACYRQPTLAGIFLGLAVGTVFFPALLLPLWISFYWRRGAGRFTGAAVLMALLCLALIGGQFLYTGELPHGIREEFIERSPWKALDLDLEGFWTFRTWAWAYRIPVFVLYTAFLIATSFWPSPKNLAHLTALSAALLIGLQLWYSHQGGIYVFWYLPLILVLMFRPNLADRRPAPIVRETDWLSRLRGAIGRMRRRTSESKKSAVHVS